MEDNDVDMEGIKRSRNEVSLNAHSANNLDYTTAMLAKGEESYKRVFGAHPTAPNSHMSMTGALRSDMARGILPWQQLKAAEAKGANKVRRYYRRYRRRAYRKYRHYYKHTKRHSKKKYSKRKPRRIIKRRK